MTAKTTQTRARTRQGGAGDRGFAVSWHLAWAMALAICIGGLVWSGVLPPGAEFLALSIAVTAALFGAGMAALASTPGAILAILVWACSGAAAGQLTGGLAGPLAAWCLMPLAAGAAFRRPALLSLGAAAGIAAAGMVAASAVLAPNPRPSSELSIWLGLIALGLTLLGFAASLVALQGRIRGENARAQDAEADLRGILEQQPLLLLALTPDGRILRSYGRPPAGLEMRRWLHHDLHELVSNDDRGAVSAALQQAQADGSAEVDFAPFHDAGGWCLLMIRRANGGGLIAALSDARAQRDRETGLQQARASAEQQNAGKSRFLANMSHELRTPLNAIMGFSDIMRQRLFGPMSDRYADYAELIHESGSHLLELINDVLDMSKIEAERFELSREDFDVREAIAAVLRLMRGQAEQAGVTLRGSLPPVPLDAEADRRALKQIALNLLSNALKFTPRGGVVTITARARGAQMLEIAVSDTGVGISQSDLARLGQPFEQAGDSDQRAGGAGLGLSLVRAFARLHGGEMIIESAMGEGTTVTVRMPVLLPVAANAPMDIPANG